jgi:hypothetical protein
MREELRKAMEATKGLTTDELNELKTHIGALVSFGPSSADKIVSASNHNDWVLMSIVDYMRANQIDLAGVPQLTGGKHYDTFKGKLPAIHNFLKPVGRRNSQLALLRLGLGLLHHDLLDLNLAVSSRLVMAHIHRLPGVINRAFPGYAQAGVLDKIIRSETGKSKHG